MLQSVFGAVCVVANVETMITDIILGNCYAVSFVLLFLNIYYSGLIHDKAEL